MKTEHVAAAPARTASRVYVWDLPTRLFHWTVFALMVAQLLTGKVLDDAMELHAKLGYAIFVLVLFRLMWGALGSTYARFAKFLRGPATVARYARSWLRRDHAFVAGHNPLGGWMVVALLAAILVQALLGMFGNDDVLFDGPLASIVSKDTSDFLTGLHAVTSDVLLVMVGLHIVAVVLHRLVNGENLVSAMVTGYKTLPSGVSAEDAQGGGVVRALILLAISIGVVCLMVL